jgi:SPP1 gp7 family putative phage head morphogenesis protein
MNKRQKEVIKYTLEQEKKIISELKDVYKKALEDIGEKIKILMSDEMTQSKIYQIEYQKALQGQISAILESLNSNQYERVHDYLKGCYEDGFIGTLYDLQGQGIPLILPLNQEEIVEALLLESKISEGLYTKMGNNVEVLKKNISFEIARGISTSSPYSQIARNLRSSANMTLNQSMRIVRTEGNRIHNKSALNACRKAKEAGADVLKMWDATLDGLTRPRHRQLDGQIREVTEDFEVDGLTVSAPLHFGIAAEDCNCRCHLLTKARWEMDEPFTKWNNEAAELMYFENIKDFQDFKKNYWNHVDNSGKSGIIKENEVIGRSVGASAKNYPVRLPDGNHAKFAEGTEITKIKVFAGNGTDMPIRNAIFLENDYGKPADIWQKVRGEGVVIFEGQKRIAEIHWYEADNEKYEIKVKRWLDEG